MSSLSCLSRTTRDPISVSAVAAAPAAAPKIPDIRLAEAITQTLCPICSTLHLHYTPKPSKTTIKAGRGAFKSQKVQRGLRMHFLSQHTSPPLSPLSTGSVCTPCHPLLLRSTLSSYLLNWFASSAYRFATDSSGLVNIKNSSSSPAQNNYDPAPSNESITSIFHLLCTPTNDEWVQFCDQILDLTEQMIDGINASHRTVEESKGEREEERSKYIASLDRIHCIARSGTAGEMEDYLRGAEDEFKAHGSVKVVGVKRKQGDVDVDVDAFNVLTEETDVVKADDAHDFDDDSSPPSLEAVDVVNQVKSSTSSISQIKSASSSSSSPPPSLKIDLALSQHMLKLLLSQDRNGSPAINWAGGRQTEESAENCEAVRMVRCIQTHIKHHRDVIGKSSPSLSLSDSPDAAEPQLQLTENESLKRRTRSGKSVLHFAARYANVNVINEILSSPRIKDSLFEGMHVDLRSNDGTTVLMMACYAPPESSSSVAQSKQHLDAVKLIVEHYGASFSLKNQWGCTVSHWAGLGGNLSIVQYLHSLGVPFCEVQKGGHNAIHKMAIKGHLKCIQYLYGALTDGERLDAGTGDDDGNKPSDIWRNLFDSEGAEWMSVRGW